MPPPNRGRAGYTPSRRGLDMMDVVARTPREELQSHIGAIPAVDMIRAFNHSAWIPKFLSFVFFSPRFLILRLIELVSEQSLINLTRLVKVFSPL